MLGAAWYPEQWPASRWDADLALMQQAGVRLVRVGEFAWSRLEPSEGNYDLDWLDRAISAAAKHGIYTVVGTPGAAPPAWLTQKYPETLRVDENGKRAEHGNRAHFNFANAKYRELTRKIAEAMAKRFGHSEKTRQRRAFSLSRLEERLSEREAADRIESRTSGHDPPIGRSGLENNLCPSC